MDKFRVEQLRKANEVPFKVVDWLEHLTPVVVHDEWGTMYRGCVLAQDCYGTYAAVVGTTDRLLRTHNDVSPDDTPYRILKIEKRITAFMRKH
ncbi:MAG: hypothetical protein P4N41_24690 [Negativicutes bacterium]|nr:hypothetical protein [Negativicutes bacterium]MDR3592869.1 hypothetical protein [Negativicutes bacterium]